MIIDGFDYGDGYTKAEIPRDDVTRSTGAGIVWRHHGDSEFTPGFLYRRPMTKEEKDKEAMETENGYKIIKLKVWGKAEMHTVEANARSIAQAYLDNPDVQAEVKRIQEERVIKAGDTVLAKNHEGSSFIFQVHDIGEDGSIRMHDLCAYSPELCTKLDPIKYANVIALLEAGVKP